jgi:hypothetical protein
VHSAIFVCSLLIIIIIICPFLPVVMSLSHGKQMTIRWLGGGESVADVVAPTRPVLLKLPDRLNASVVAVVVVAAVAVAHKAVTTEAALLVLLRRPSMRNCIDRRFVVGDNVWSAMTALILARRSFSCNKVMEARRICGAQYSYPMSTSPTGGLLVLVPVVAVAMTTTAETPLLLLWWWLWWEKGSIVVIADDDDDAGGAIMAGLMPAAAVTSSISMSIVIPIVENVMVVLRKLFRLLD